MKFEKNFSVAYIQKRRPIWSYIETLAITLALLAILWLIRPSDPLCMTGPIPWIALAPLFCSLIYGTFNGLLSLIMILAYLLFLEAGTAIDTLPAREYIFGLTAFSLIPGIFSSYWMARIGHVEHLNQYVRDHLEDLSRDYYMLRISHERLEHAYITRPMSFRDAFYHIGQQIIREDCQIGAQSGERLLGIFSQYCSINSAALCLYDEPLDELQTIATLGQYFFISREDSLIRLAMNRRITGYLAVNTLQSDDTSMYLAVIPLLNLNHQLLGLIVIKDMPFWSLTHDTLETLTVFSSYFSLQWQTIKTVEPLLKIFPDCSPAFLRELQILIQLKTDHGIDSALSGVLVPEDLLQDNIVNSLEQQKRSLDYAWIVPWNSAKLFITLMPLTGQDGIQGYRKRLNDWVKSEFGRELNKNGLIFRYIPLTDAPAEEQINNLIKELTYDPQ